MVFRKSFRNIVLRINSLKAIVYWLSVKQVTIKFIRLDRCTCNIQKIYTDKHNTNHKNHICVLAIFELHHVCTCIFTQH